MLRPSALARPCPPFLVPAQGIFVPLVGKAGGLHGTTRGVELRVQVDPVERAHLVVEVGRRRRAGYPGGGADDVVGVPLPHNARAHTGAAAVAAANHNRRAPGKPTGARGLRRHPPRHIGGGVQLRQKVPADVKGLYQFLRPGLGTDVQQIGAGAIAVVCHDVPGQLEDHVVLCVDHLVGFCVKLWPVLLDPQQLRRRIGRAQAVPISPGFVPVFSSSSLVVAHTASHQAAGSCSTHRSWW